jgi:hypothetical protein
LGRNAPAHTKRDERRSLAGAPFYLGRNFFGKIHAVSRVMHNVTGGEIPLPYGGKIIFSHRYNRKINHYNQIFIESS